MFTLPVDDNLHLRLADPKHFEAVYALADANHTYLGQYLGWINRVPSLDAALERRNVPRQQFATQSALVTHIIYDGEPVGAITLSLTHRPGMGSFGYWLGEAFTGKGIVTRCVQALMDIGFLEYDLHKLIIGAATDNPRSYAVAERLGYQREATFRQHFKLKDDWHDWHQYAMLRDEWDAPATAPVFAHRLDDDSELRLLEPRHAEALYTLVDSNREHLRQWLPWIDDQTSVQDSRGFIASTLQQYADFDGLQCGIWHKGELAGVVGYHYWDTNHGKTEIGYWLGEAFTGRGLMTRSVTALIDYAFKVIGLQRIEIPCATGNTKSCAIPQRLGFTHEGVLRRAENLYGRYVDWNMFALLADEWQPDTSPNT